MFERWAACDRASSSPSTTTSSCRPRISYSLLLSPLPSARSPSCPRFLSNPPSHLLGLYLSLGICFCLRSSSSSGLQTPPFPVSLPLFISLPLFVSILPNLYLSLTDLLLPLSIYPAIWESGRKQKEGQARKRGRGKRVMLQYTIHTATTSSLTQGIPILFFFLFMSENLSF